MNGHTMQVFLYELRRNLRRKGYLFTTFGVPLIAIVLLFGYQVITNANSGRDNAQQSLAQQFDFQNVKHAGYVDLSGLFSDPGDLSSLLTPYPDEAAARAALDSGDISIYYVIAQDYLQTGDVTLVQPRLDISEIQSAPIHSLVLNTLSKGVDPQIVQRLIDPSNVQFTNLTLVGAENGPQNKDTSFIVVYIFALALMISLFTTNGYLMQSVIEEKETRLIEILLSTVRPSQLLAGKILALGLIGMLQIVVWIGSILLIVRLSGGQAVGALATLAAIQIPVNILPTLLIYFIFAYFLFAGLYSIVGALSNSLREGPQFAVIFTIPAVLPLYFLTLFASSPDGPIPTILSLIPITAPLAMAERLVISNVPLWQVLVSMVLLVLSGIGVMWVAGRVFRVQVLLAGQMPKLKDLPRLLRG